MASCRAGGGGKAGRRRSGCGGPRLEREAGRKGVYRKALQHLELAASGLPESPEVQNHLGVAYAGLEDKPRAEAALEKALRLSQDFDGATEARELLAKLKE